ncbi:MAG: enoyl-CoA hydratase/isomerase family protein [Chloroflexi bacterium]|nr:enoyl-CoA hydratase/isomerase family protein [Chloroflexota bacterium]
MGIQESEARSQMAYLNIVYGKSAEGVATITLNRPRKLNAWNDALVEEVDAALRESEGDKGVKVVVFKGAGRSFSVGRDLSGVGTDKTMPPDFRKRPYWTEFLASERAQQSRWQYIFDYPKPTIAQIQGYCLDYGLYLSMVCDFSIVAADAKLGDPAVRIGHVTQMPLWTLIVGNKLAKLLLFTGKMISGAEAEQIGLVSRVVAASQLEATTARLAKDLCAMPHNALARLKETIHSAMDAKGAAAGWRFFGEHHLFSAVQPVMPGEFAFLDVRDERGLEEAIRECNAPYDKLAYYREGK